MDITRPALLTVLIAVSAAPVAAQFQSLVTTDDGAIVLFSSPLRMKATDEPLWPKLFITDPSGQVRLFEQANPPQQSPIDAPRNLLGADLSADGSTVAIIREARCLVPSDCAFPSYFSSEIRPASGTSVSVDGIVRISASGEHAVAISNPVRLLDLRSHTNTSTDVTATPRVPSQGARMVANDGRVVAVQDGKPTQLILIGRDGTSRVLATPIPPAAAAIADDLTVIAYETAPVSGAPAVRLMYGPGGTDAEIVAAAEGCRQPVLSSDGKTLLFVSAANFEGHNNSAQPQAWIIGTDGTGLHQLTADRSGIAEAAISGDGTVVWAVTYGGRLVRVDVQTREVTEIVGRTPLYTVTVSARGSLSTIDGRGLTDGTVVPHITIAGESVPVLSARPTQIRFQMPWDAQAGALTIEAGDSPFALTQPNASAITPVDVAAAFILTANGTVAAAHSDFHGPITAQDPARPGETIHLYMTGLGPVSPAVPTGTLSPSNPPAVLAAPLHLRLSDQAADVLFAGLAPTMIGVYQVSVELPAPIPMPACFTVQNQSACIPVKTIP